MGMKARLLTNRLWPCCLSVDNPFILTEKACVQNKVYEGAEGQLAAAVERLERRQEEQAMYGDDQRVR